MKKSMLSKKIIAVVIMFMMIASPFAPTSTFFTMPNAFAADTSNFTVSTEGYDIVTKYVNETGAAIEGNFILGAYDEAGRLLNLYAQPFSAAAGGTAQYTFTGIRIEDIFTAYCWDNNFAPLAKTISGFSYFDLVVGGTAADVYVDEADWPGVIHAAENLTNDIELVTGVSATLKSSSEGLSKFAVIAGSIGNNPVIDELIDQGKLDVSEIEGEWESYTHAFIPNPMPGVKLGLVIAGSDKRGTVFGIYKVSEMIGVSPWTFFADSVPSHQDELKLQAKSFVQGEPSVKYRGIFINDERSLDRWMNQYAVTHDFIQPYYMSRGAYRFTHEFYTEVFDMILRQYGNYLWPAMWNNSFWKDDELNGVLADEYGIVIGTTHQEFMNCPDKEWVWSNLGNFEWINPNYPVIGEWRYTNKDAMITKWTQTMTDTKNFETVVNMGLRGLSDVAIFPRGTQEQNIALLNEVIGEQRKIIQNVYGHTDVPQSVIIYKEVEAFYYGDAADPTSGWKASIADDITTILCDDNHGNVRGLPNDLNRDREGGFGMYYHFDYNGAPRSYRWMDASPLEKIREQMMMAYDYGVDRIWVTNVGDLKFNEAPIDYWLKLAYDVETWGGLDGPAKAHKAFAAQEFGEELADEIADLIFDYSFMNGVRKGEIVFANTFSLTYFNEAENMLAKYTDIAKRALEVKKQIPPERMDAYYNLVLYPTLISWNAWNLAVNLGKNQIYRGLGITAANDYAEIARASLAFDNFSMQYIYGDPRIKDATYETAINTIKTWLGPLVGDNIIDADANAYYCVGNGKYYGFYPRRNLTSPNALVADTSIYYLLLTSWAHRTSQMTFATTGTAYNSLINVTPAATPAMVVMPQPWLGTSIPNARTGSIDLHKFTSYGNEKRYIDVATTGNADFNYTAVSNSEWIVIDKTGGTVGANNKIDRIYVSIDWSKAPAGADANGSITVTGAGATVTVNVTAERFDTSSLPAKTFIEDDGYISILSTNYAKSVSAMKDGVSYEWTQLPDYGRELSSMKVMPTALDAGFGGGRVPDVDSPYLEYNVYIKTPGTIDIVTQWAPTNGMDARQITTLQYAVSLGDETPKTVNTLSRNFLVNNAGGIMWADGAESATRTITTRNNGERCISSHSVSAPGVYTLRIYMVNDGLTLQKVLLGTNTLARTSVAAANGTDTMVGGTFQHPAYTTPTLLTGARDGYLNNIPGSGVTATSSGTLSTYFGPPESFFTSTEPQ